MSLVFMEEQEEVKTWRKAEIEPRDDVGIRRRVLGAVRGSRRADICYMDIIWILSGCRSGGRSAMSLRAGPRPAGMSVLSKSFVIPVLS